MSQTTTSNPWLGVEPRHLATFAAVAETRSFRTAAGRFDYVQSAVSQQIARLEKSTGRRLLDRHGNRALTLTREGTTLLEHAERVVQHVNAACADVECVTGRRSLRIVAEPLAGRHAAEAARRLRQVIPAARLEISSAPGFGHAELLLRGDADVAIGCHDRAVRGSLESRPLYDDQWQLVTPSGWTAGRITLLDPLAALEDATVIDCRTYPAPVDPDEHGARTLLTCDTATAALELVRAGHGCGFLPLSAVAQEADGVDCFNLDGFVPSRAISVSWAKARKLRALFDAFGESAPQEDAVELLAEAA